MSLMDFVVGRGNVTTYEELIPKQFIFMIFVRRQQQLRCSRTPRFLRTRTYTQQFQDNEMRGVTTPLLFQDIVLKKGHGKCYFQTAITFINTSTTAHHWSV
jgi:hypothetical protein